MLMQQYIYFLYTCFPTIVQNIMSTTHFKSVLKTKIVFMPLNSVHMTCIKMQHITILTHMEEMKQTIDKI